MKKVERDYIAVLRCLDYYQSSMVGWMGRRAQQEEDNSRAYIASIKSSIDILINFMILRKCLSLPGSQSPGLKNEVTDNILRVPLYTIFFFFIV